MCPGLNMLLITGVGSFLATDFAGILSKEARKYLNNVSKVILLIDLQQRVLTYCVIIFILLIMLTATASFSKVFYIYFFNLQIVFYVFNPSLVAIYLAKTITMESLAKL